MRKLRWYMGLICDGGRPLALTYVHHTLQHCPCVVQIQLWVYVNGTQGCVFDLQQSSLSCHNTFPAHPLPTVWKNPEAVYPNEPCIDWKAMATLAYNTQMCKKTSKEMERIYQMLKAISLDGAARQLLGDRPTPEMVSTIHIFIHQKDYNSC